MTHVLRTALLIPALITSLSLQAASLIKVDDHYMQQHFAIGNSSLIAHNKDYSFKPQKITLINGVVKNKYTLFYNGIPIYNTVLTSTEEQGKQFNWQGNLVADIEDDIASTEPTINKQKIVELMLKKAHLNTQQTIKHPKAELFIRLNEKNKAELIYLISYSVEGIKAERPFFIVNAHTGVIIKSWDGLTTFNAEGPGGNAKTGRYYYGKDYGPLIVSDTCSMTNDKVEVYDMQQQTSGGDLFQFACPVNNYKPINGAFSPLNDALYFGTKVIEMYKSWYALNPLDQKFKMRVHFGQSYDNAFWDGRQMTFGDGGVATYLLTAIDMIGHEVSHAVIEKYSKLVYVKQSGGINEAFSDIAGETAKFYINHEFGKSNDWLMGSSVMKTPGLAMRYFANPKQDGVSIDNAADYSDALNVHYTSGVFNKAFYLLASRDKWGIKKAFSVFLTANQVYWESEATFDSAACGVARAAVDLKYNAKAVVVSFKEVGVDANCTTSA